MTKPAFTLMNIQQATKTYTILMGAWILTGFAIGYFHSIGALIAWFVSGMTIPYMDFNKTEENTHVQGTNK